MFAPVKKSPKLLRPHQIFFDGKSILVNRGFFEELNSTSKMHWPAS